VLSVGRLPKFGGVMVEQHGGADEFGVAIRKVGVGEAVD
jgi:hypothetical protein